MRRKPLGVATITLTCALSKFLKLQQPKVSYDLIWNVRFWKKKVTLKQGELQLVLLHH